MKRLMFLGLGFLASCKGVDQVGNAFGVVSGGGAGGGFEVTLLTLNPSAYDFGAVTLNATSTKAIEVSNSGQTAVTIGDISLSGNSSFSQTNNCGSSLGIGQSCRITVSFTPTSSVSVRTILNIEYNDGGQKAMGLSGQGGSSLVFNGIDTVTNVGASSARLNWSAATGGSVTSYQVQRLIDGNWVVISGVPLPNTARHYVDNSLDPATTYSWRVYAIDSFGVPDGNTVVKTAATSVIDFDSVDPDDLSVSEGSTTTATLSCSDTIGSTPAYFLDGQSDSDAGCSISGSTLTCTPTYKTSHVNWTSDITLRCLIDGVPITNVETLTVVDSTRPPVLTVPASRAFPNHLPVGTALTLTSSATDPDGDTLTFSCTVRSSNLSSADPNYMASGSNCNSLPAIQDTTATFNSTTGVLSWTPRTTQFATYEFGITVSDGYGGTDSESFSLTVAPPQHRGAAPAVFLDALYADAAGPGVSDQPTTWNDLSGNGFHGTIVGTNDNGSGHWKGNGTYTSPYRLSLDGTNDYVQLSGTAMPSNYLGHLIRFRIPSTAPDGAHPIVSLMNKGVIAVIKGAGANYIQATSYASGNTWTMTGTIEYDKWYALYYSLSALNGDGYVIIYDGNNVGASGFIETGWSSALTIDNQAGVGSNQFYLGYKPAAVGPVGGPFIQGTAVYGHVEYLSLKIVTSFAEHDKRQDDYFFHERLKQHPLGDTKLSSLAYAIDAAANSRLGYDSLNTFTNCNSLYSYGSITGAKYNSLDYVWQSPRLGHHYFNNPGCLDTDQGFIGSGVPSDPYRWDFTGVTSAPYQSSMGYATFSYETKANSFDLWFQVGNSHNADVGGAFPGYGPALVAMDHQNGGAKFYLRTLNNGDGTSKLQFYTSSPWGSLMSKGETDIGINLENSEWYHAAITVTAAGQLIIYINGVQSYASSVGYLTDHPFCYSLSNSCSYPFFGGGYDWKFSNTSIALFRVYAGRTLSHSEVLYNCNHDKARFQGATCGY